MRTLGKLLILLGCGLAGCASGAWRDTAPSDPGPLVAGLPMDAALASIHRAPAEDAKLSVSEVRVLGLDREPWPTVSVDDALGSPGQYGMTARRQCRRWDGLRRTETVRASWYVFDGGVLRAFDHYEFDARCDARNVFEPSPPAGVSTERTLVRFVAQRYPRARGTITERMEKGLRFVAVGRLDDAEAEYDAGTRTLEDILVQRKMKPGVPDPVLDQREAELRPLHRQLHAAILEARREEREARREEREIRREERERGQREAVSAAP